MQLILFTNGQFGNIRTVKVWCYQGWMKPVPVVPDTAPPEGVDYDDGLAQHQQNHLMPAAFILISDGSGIMLED